nr:imidazole glycerol phosphate synthase cyclase subunit [Spartinivicinus marinus]
MPTLLWKDFGLVKGISFDSNRRVGALLPSIKVYSVRDVDELILLDITATEQNRLADVETIKDISKEVFVPFTVGGGIKKAVDIKNILLAGADKVTINTESYKNNNIIEEGAKIFGSQCIVASIDFKRVNGKTFCVSHAGTKVEPIEVTQWAKTVENMGAGEILLTSVDKDGRMDGFDYEIVGEVTSLVNIPVIASGGAGCAQDIYEVIKKGGASAIAAASIFHFTEQTPQEIKEYLYTKGINVRR